jgi:hypothetical protein
MTLSAKCARRARLAFAAQRSIDMAPFLEREATWRAAALAVAIESERVRAQEEFRANSPSSEWLYSMVYFTDVRCLPVHGRGFRLYSLSSLIHLFIFIYFFYRKMPRGIQCRGARA